MSLEKFQCTIHLESIYIYIFQKHDNNFSKMKTFFITGKFISKNLILIK